MKKKKKKKERGRGREEKRPSYPSLLLLLSLLSSPRRVGPSRPVPGNGERSEFGMFYFISVFFFFSSHIPLTRLS